MRPFFIFKLLNSTNIFFSFVKILSTMKNLLMKGLFAALTFAFTQVFAQSPTATIPFELYGDHIFIQLKVNNSRNLDFIFDSADALAVVDEDVAREIGLSMDQKSTKASAGGSTSGYLVKHQKVSIKDLEVKNMEVYATDLNHLEISIGRKIDGIIGYDILDNYTVAVDYDKMEFRFYDSSSFSYSGTGLAFDVKLNTYIPHIAGTVVLQNGEKLTGEFWVDTGAKAALDFNTPFVNSHKLISKLPKTYSYMVSGLGKEESLHHRGKVKEFTFGSFKFENIPVGLSQASGGLQANSKIAGIIGNEVLMQFNIVYDYARKKMYFEPNGNYGQPIADDASGFDLQYSGDMTRLLIHRVHENSPASLAGIKVDDELLSIDGKEVSSMKLPDIRKLLSESGRQVQLTLKSGNQQRNVSLALDQII